MIDCVDYVALQLRKMAEIPQENTAANTIGIAQRGDVLRQMGGGAAANRNGPVRGTLVNEELLRLDRD